jgi:hypothetical protein
MRKTVFDESGRTALGSQLLGESRSKMKKQWMFEEQMRLPSGLLTRTSLVQDMYRIVGWGMERLSRLTVLAKAEADRGKETPQESARDQHHRSCVLVKHMGLFIIGMLRAVLGFAFVPRSINSFGWQFSSTYMTERSIEIKGPR